MKRRKRNLTQITLYIEIEQRERLDALSEKTDVPVSAYVRRAIDLFLQKEAE